MLIPVTAGSVLRRWRAIPVLVCAVFVSASVARADGVIDSQYGSGGQAVVPVGAGGQIGGLAPGSELESAVAEWGAGFTGSSGSQSTLLAIPRIDGSGALVGGPGGISFGSFPGFGVPVGIVRQPDGTFVAAAGSPAGIVLEHLRADATPDPAYGTGGFATIAGSPACPLIPSGIAPGPNGSVFVVGDANAQLRHACATPLLTTRA